MSWFFGLFSAPWAAYAAAAGAVLLAASWGTVGWDHAMTIPHLERDVKAARKETQDEKAGRLADRTVAAEAHARDVEKKVAEERANTQRAMTAQKEGDAKITQLQSDLAARDDASRRLRDRFQALVSAARRPAAASGPAGSGPTPGEAAGMLADVCERADRRAGVLAEYADRLRISAEACISAWPLNITPPASDLQQVHPDG